MEIGSSGISEDQSCFKFSSETLCTSPGTAVQSIRNESGLIVPYLVGQILDVGKVVCVSVDEEDENEGFYEYDETGEYDENFSTISPSTVSIEISSNHNNDDHEENDSTIRPTAGSVEISSLNDENMIYVFTKIAPYIVWILENM